MISLYAALQIARHSNGGIFILDLGGKLNAIKGHPDDVVSMTNLVAFVIPSIDGIFSNPYADKTADWEFRTSGQFDGSESPILVYKDEEIEICKDGGGRFCIFSVEHEGYCEGYVEESNPMDSNFFLSEGDDGGFLYR